MENVRLKTDYNKIIDNAIKAGVEYVNENKIKAMVVGVSGGIDSALTAFLARKVCGQTGAQLIARSMPIWTNKTDEIERAAAVGQKYAHDFVEADLTGAVSNMLRAVDISLYGTKNEDLTIDEKIMIGNIKARCRMIYLYHLARKNNGMVLSTDNLTELMLGFWTLHGDVGDFGFIQKAWKTEVYGMGDIIGGPVADCCAANPTDGLGVTRSDIDQLLPNWTPEMGDHRAAYRLVDDIIIGHMTGNGTFAKDHPVIKRVEGTNFKRANPVSIERDLLLWTHG